MSRGADKIAISLDRELLARAERLRQSTGESRSALVARALRQLVATETHSRLVEEYVAGYRRQPETGADVRTLRAFARRSLAALAWDDS